MTIGQMRLFLKEGERIKRQQRATFVADVYLAAGAVMGGKDGADAVRSRLDELLGN